jgi:hypothetical protein
VAAFRYYQFDYTAYNTTAIMVQEVELLGSAGTDITTTGMTVSACGYHTTGLEPYRAYDNAANQWQHNLNHAHWLRIDLGSGNEQEVLGYNVTGSAQNTYTPTGWNLKGSNDLSAWTTISTVSTSAWAANEVRSFDTIYTPPLQIETGSSVAFFGRGLTEQAFAINSSSAAAFFNPYRDFTIQSGSLFEPKTWLRTFAFEAKSELSIRAGSIATSVTASSFDLQVLGLFQSDTSIAASSATDMRASWIHNAKATVKAKSFVSIAGAYNKDFGIFVSSRSTFSPAQSSTVSSAFSASPKSTGAFAARRLLPSDFSIASASAMLNAFRVQSPAGFSVSTASDSAFSGLFANAGGFASSAYSDALFVGTYQYTAPVEFPDPDAVFYVTTKRNEITVFS